MGHKGPVPQGNVRGIEWSRSIWLPRLMKEEGMSIVPFTNKVHHIRRRLDQQACTGFMS